MYVFLRQKQTKSLIGSVRKISEPQATFLSWSIKGQNQARLLPSLDKLYDGVTTVNEGDVFLLLQHFR